MDLINSKYKGIALVKEMLETPGIIRNFKPEESMEYAEKLRSRKKLLLTGEGSSRIFPAKRAIQYALQRGLEMSVFTEGSTQAIEYDLRDVGVLGASNSGQTKELMRLILHLKDRSHNCFFGITASKNSRLEEHTLATRVLNCGKENAVAATKSVMEQALFYDSLIRNMAGLKMEGLDRLADQVEEVLSMKTDDKIIDKLSSAEMIYFSGRNNGAAEELALKTNEICRKKSDFLEGTYALHGIEEVMSENETLVLVSPFKEEESKYVEYLEKGVGMPLIAIADRETSFPTVKIPGSEQYSEYIELAAGWNLLVETGISLGIDLDKPQRARKVGNQF